MSDYQRMTHRWTYEHPTLETEQAQNKRIVQPSVDQTRRLKSLEGFEARFNGVQAETAIHYTHGVSIPFHWSTES